MSVRMFGIAALDARRGVTISVSVVQYPLIVVSAAQGGYYIKLERWCRKARAKHVCAHQGLLQTITKLDQAPLALDASAAEVCAAAGKHAQHCRQKREAMQPVLSVNLTTPIVYAALRVSLRLVSPSSFIACSLCRFFARVSLIRKCNLDGLSRYLLGLTRKLCHLSAPVHRPGLRARPAIAPRCPPQCGPWCRVCAYNRHSPHMRRSRRLTASCAYPE
jgi:hypothetical protein